MSSERYAQVEDCSWLRANLPKARLARFSITHARAIPSFEKNWNPC